MIPSPDYLAKTEKINEIINAAQIRFGLYGIEKTTMREIASDLNMTKGSLYYYFPDKEHLFIAVVEKEQREFLNILQKNTEQNDDPALLLKEYGKTRLVYFRTLLNISRLRFESFAELTPQIADIMKEFTKKEKEILESIFEDGNRKGIFNIADTDDLSSLFLDLLKGIRIAVVNKKKLLYIDQVEFDTILKKTNSFTEIFINGLTVR